MLTTAWRKKRYCISEAAKTDRELEAWSKARNAAPSPVDWQFTTADARIKLRRLYPHTI